MSTTLTKNPPSAPILVTGAHRSGTTWVGKMLAAGGGLAYISEPLNVLHRPGVMRAPVEHWYTYISPDNESQYLDAFRHTLALRYQPFRELAALRSPKDLLRMARDSFTFTRARLLHHRPLLKDPFAIFSAPWFASRLDCQVVCIVRHPAALVSSHKRLGWSFSFDDILAQPQLIQDCLQPFRSQIEQAAHHPGDLIERASLLWNIVHHVIDQYRTSHPHYHILRHEDLSIDPLRAFADLYAKLDLPFNARARKAIAHSTGSGNPTELTIQDKYSIHLDSRANLKNWQSRLTPDEINRIRTLTQFIAPRFYTDADWE